MNLGQFYVAKGDHQKGLSYFKNVLDEDEGFITIYSLMLNAYESLNITEDDPEYLSFAVLLVKNVNFENDLFESSFHDLAELLLEERQYVAALFYYSLLNEEYPQKYEDEWKHAEEVMFANYNQ